MTEPNIDTIYFKTDNFSKGLDPDCCFNRGSTLSEACIGNREILHSIKKITKLPGQKNSLLIYFDQGQVEVHHRQS